MASIIPNSQFSKIFNPLDGSISSTQPIPQIKTSIPTNKNPSAMNAGIILEPQKPSLISQLPVPTAQPEQDDSSRFLGSLIAQGLAGIGTGLMGGSASDIQRSAGMFESMRSQQASRDRAKLLMDPKSEESRKRREVYKSLGYKVGDNLSATDLNDPTVLQSLKNKMEEQKLAAMPRGGIGVGGTGKPKEEQLKEKKLSQDERQLLNNSAMAYKALFDLDDAIKRKVPKVTAAGDNDYTFAANRFSEGLGRMQSGGAIGTEEEKKFLKLIPGVFDTEDTANKKIKTMKTDLEARLKSIGYDPKTILESRSYTEDEISPSEQDQAIKWANQNINSKDENNRLKAEKILKGI